MIQQRAVGPLHLVTSGDNASGSHMLVVSNGPLAENDIVCPVGASAGHVQVGLADKDAPATRDVPLWMCCHGTTGAGQQVRVARIRVIPGNTLSMPIGTLLYLTDAGAAGGAPGGSKDTIVAMVLTQATDGRVLFDPSIKLAT
jgi:hypothetical protein